MYDDRGEVRQEILVDQSKRMYRQGGRAPANWKVVLAAAVCGFAPFLLTIPTSLRSTPRIRLVPFEPIALDLAIPLAVMLTAAATTWWAAPAQRRWALMVAALVAAIPNLGIYLFAGISRGMVYWMILHFTMTIGTVLAIIIALRVGAPPSPPSKRRSFASALQHRAGRAPGFDDPLERYKPSPWFPRRSRQWVAGQAE